MGGCPVACIMAESARVLECATTIQGASLEDLTAAEVMQFVWADSSSSTSLNSVNSITSATSERILLFLLSSDLTDCTTNVQPSSTHRTRMTGTTGQGRQVFCVPTA